MATAVNAAAIIVAGGEGARMQAGRNKVFLEVAGQSILDRSLALMESSPEVGDIVLVARAAEVKNCESLRAKYRKLTQVVAGGDVRHRSEFAGVQALAARIDARKIDVVLVHDAVRPFASKELVRRLLAGIDGAVGCVPGSKVSATTMRVVDGWLDGRPSNLWAVQTPQAFEATWLLEAHNRAVRQGFIGTDTASVIEWAGGEVAVIEGEADNIKITTPADLIRAEKIAAGR
jgi:2-C-methyl-D-erythritol 4-phosphate cytidylyltransferase